MPERSSATHHVQTAFLPALLMVIAVAVWGTCVGLAVAQTPGGSGAVLSQVRLGEHPQTTRFVAELSDEVGFSLTLLDNPYRLSIEFQNVDWQASSDHGPGHGLVRYYARQVLPDGGTRILLDLSAPVRVRDVFYLPATETIPFRFVLDLEETDPESFSAAMSAVSVPEHALFGPTDPPPGSVDGPAAAAFSGLYPEPRPLPRLETRPVIAIDPGHGGRDPGAISPSGVFERTITLQVALALRDTLLAAGIYDIVMTRETDDEYVPLRERVERAREAGATLFLSLHADANPSASVRGASVYTLSNTASDREAAMLAARENRADALNGVHMDPEDGIMATILIDLAQRVTHTDSNVMAELLVDRLGTVTPLLVNTHREAGFAVLTAPDLPSVLIELGHLSSPDDEALLTDPLHQALLVSAISAAIDDYHRWLADSDRS